VRIPLLFTMLLVAPLASAYTFELSGPPVIHVGDTVTYDAQIALSPGENLWSVTTSLFVDNGRQLAEWDPVVADSKEREGFQDTGFLVDPIESEQPEAPHPGSDIPVWIYGELYTPIDRVAMTADHGPFTVVFFTLTALAPGQLEFVAAQGLYPQFDGTSFLIPNGGVHYTFLTGPYDPNTDPNGPPFAPSGSVAPGPDGVFATITIPEPSLAALSVLSLATLASIVGERRADARRSRP